MRQVLAVSPSQPAKVLPLKSGTGLGGSKFTKLVSRASPKAEQKKRKGFR
jgi:hypothetical protein